MTSLSPSLFCLCCQRRVSWMLAESEVDVHNLSGAIKDAEVESKDTLSNVEFWVLASDSASFPHTHFRGMDGSDSVCTRQGRENTTVVKPESWKRLLWSSSPLTSHPPNRFFLKTLLKALWPALLFWFILFLFCLHGWFCCLGAKWNLEVMLYFTWLIPKCLIVC